MRALVAADLMTPEVLAVRLDMTVPELATFLLDNEVTGAVVKNERGHPVGVVSFTDIAAAAESDSDTDDTADTDDTGDFYLGPQAAGAAEAPEVQNLQALAVSEIMTPRLHFVAPTTPVSEVATTLLDLRLHRLLVIDGDELVGIISTSDLIGLLIESA